MSEGFVGAALAARIAAQLGDLGLVAKVRELPPWPGATPETGAAITVEVAGAPRPVALVETWHVQTFGPQALTHPKWACDKSALPFGQPPRIPETKIARGLAEIAKTWASRESELGLLDVVFALVDTLPPTPGGWRAQVVGADEAWIGVQRDDGRRWPAFLQIRGLSDSFEILHRGTLRDERWRLRTRDDYQGVTASLVTRVAELHAWCERFVDDRRALEKLADLLCVELGRAHLPPLGGDWRVWTPTVDAFSSRDPPRAWIETTLGLFSLLEVDGGAVVDGVAYPEDAPLQVLVESIATAATSRASCPLRPGERYQLRQPLAGFTTEDILRFRKAEDIRPNDTLFYSFEAVDPRATGGIELVDGARRVRGLALSEVEPEDARVMAAMADWFRWIEDELDPDRVRKRRIDCLVAVGKHLREHGELEAAGDRLREAMKLDPDHPAGNFQSGWLAAQEQRWHEAVDFFRRAVELDEQNIDARHNEAWSLGHLGRWQEALALLDELLVTHPEHVLARTNRAWVQKNLGSASG